MRVSTTSNLGRLYNTCLLLQQVNWSPLYEERFDEEEDLEEAVGDDVASGEDYSFFLVEQVLTDSVVHFSSLMNTLVDLWHPLGGMTITKIGDKRILFHLYNVVDFKRIMDGMPLFFNTHLIVFHKVAKGEDLDQVSLFFSLLGIQVHNLPIGFMTEGMAWQF
ncbi:hypothetical protein J1N35_022790 [Gossypium stocksii]|uniref:DUF4283 domain-containing protein n=1 Tax=Gossypium stocksii TaxID=47602 RepID=A0A9D3VJ59_9ROSI|nr:hypothetical protein J1N35_022790 [Gossypium stocksii]